MDSIWDMLPEEEAVIPRTNAITQENMGLAPGRCAQCGAAFEYFRGYHRYKLVLCGRQLVFCSYGCMRARERELEAAAEARQRARDAAQLEADQRQREARERRADHIRRMIERYRARMDSPEWAGMTSKQRSEIRRKLRLNREKLEEMERADG